MCGLGIMVYFINNCLGKGIELEALQDTFLIFANYKVSWTTCS